MLTLTSPALVQSVHQRQDIRKGFTVFSPINFCGNATPPYHVRQNIVPAIFPSSKVHFLLIKKVCVQKMDSPLIKCHDVPSILLSTHLVCVPVVNPAGFIFDRRPDYQCSWCWTIRCRQEHRNSFNVSPFPGSPRLTRCEWPKNGKQIGTLNRKTYREFICMWKCIFGTGSVKQCLQIPGWETILRFRNAVSKVHAVNYSKFQKRSQFDLLSTCSPSYFRRLEPANRGFAFGTARTVVRARLSGSPQLHSGPIIRKHWWAGSGTRAFVVILHELACVPAGYDRVLRGESFTQII